MLTEIYIEALLVDEDLADQAWELLESEQIDTDTAIFEWAMIPIRENGLHTRAATIFAARQLRTKKDGVILVLFGIRITADDL